MESRGKCLPKPLRIGIDFRFLQGAYRNSSNGGIGGVGVYSRGLWRQLALSFPSNQYVAIVDHGPIPDRLSELLDLAPTVEIRKCGLGGRSRLLSRIDRSSFSWLLRALESEFGFGVKEALNDLDVLHVLNQAPPPKVCKPTVLTLYDLCQVGAGEPAHSISMRERLRRGYLKRISRADALVCISEATKRDAALFLEVAEGQCSVVYPGIDLETYAPKKDNLSTQLLAGLSSGFFLHVGVCAGRKNPRVLLAAVKAASVKDKSFFFVFVGPYQVNQGARLELESLAKELDLSDRVVILGDVSDQSLASLYQHARALVFPSLYEGFGYPPAEALASGGSCIVSNTSSLPEAIGDFGILVDPNDAESICAAMLEMLSVNRKQRSVEQKRQWAEQFSWSIAAESYMQVYRRLSNAHRNQ